MFDNGSIRSWRDGSGWRGVTSSIRWKTRDWGWEYNAVVHNAYKNLTEFRNHGGLLFMDSDPHFCMVQTVWTRKSFRLFTCSHRSKGLASNYLLEANWNSVILRRVHRCISPCTRSKVIVLLTQVHLIELIILVESSTCLSTQPPFLYVWFQEHTRCFRNAFSLLRIVLLFKRIF